jgi:hypothetical protein
VISARRNIAAPKCTGAPGRVRARHHARNEAVRQSHEPCGAPRETQARGTKSACTTPDGRDRDSHDSRHRSGSEAARTSPSSEASRLPGTTADDVRRRVKCLGAPSRRRRGRTTVLERKRSRTKNPIIGLATGASRRSNNPEDPTRAAPAPGRRASNSFRRSPPPRHASSAPVPGGDSAPGLAVFPRQHGPQSRGPRVSLPTGDPRYEYPPKPDPD